MTTEPTSLPGFSPGREEENPGSEIAIETATFAGRWRFQITLMECNFRLVLESVYYNVECQFYANEQMGFFKDANQKPEKLKSSE